jgi:hypothetical protein
MHHGACVGRSDDVISRRRRLFWSAYALAAVCAFVSVNWRVSWLQARIRPFVASIDLATDGLEQTFELTDFATSSYTCHIEITFPSEHAALWDSQDYQGQDAQVRKDTDCDVEFDITDPKGQTVHRSASRLVDWTYTNSRVEVGATASLYDWRFDAKSFTRYTLKLRVTRGNPSIAAYHPRLFFDPEYNDFFSLARPIYNDELIALFVVPLLVYGIVRLARRRRAERAEIASGSPHS